jgi:hypothetical protein
MNGKVYFVDEPLGRGHDARIISHDVVWIDGGRVMKATPDTPQAPSGEFAPYPCA